MNIIWESNDAMAKAAKIERETYLNSLLAMLSQYSDDDEQRQELLEKIRVERLNLARAE